MDTLNFLQRVLPEEGFYVVTVINEDGPRQGYFPSVETLAKSVLSLDQRGNNTYFAISSFIEKGNRKQDNVQATKVVALDVDCGEDKPFSDWKEGLKALLKFVTDQSLPKPMIIHSGNGLHVYWVLTEALAPEQWLPIASAMKAAALDKGFEIDPAVPADSARVLRPVGTTNRKNGAVVKLLVDAEPVTPDMLTSALLAYIGAFPQKAKNKHTTGSKLSQALAVQTDLPPAVASVVMQKCQQIKWAAENQTEVAEPVWYDLIGVAAYCQDPEGTAVLWSKDHPDFDHVETVAKMQRWKDSTTGPTTCAKFEMDRPGGCKGCKYKDKIGSPARLGTQYQEIAAPTEVPDKAAAQIDIPKPFKRTAAGIKVTIDDTDVDVCDFDLYPVGYGRDESLGYETVRYHWNRPHAGWQELSFRQAYLTDGHREFATAIADQGILLKSKRQTEYFQMMLRSYMDELRQKRAMTNLYSTMGWKENFSQFVIGNTVLRRNADGSVSEEQITLASGSQRLGNELYETAGSEANWVKFTTLMEKADLLAHMFALCVSFSAPLYAFTGLKGLTISLYGPTGGGKTLAQYWQQSIWGVPEKLHFAAKFTQNTLFGRMGLYSHLPMTIDEVTMMADKEVGDFAYWVSQGRDKARLNRNAEERDAKTWAMPVTVSTNRSLSSKLIASGLDTDAQMARILEVSVPSHPLFARDSAAGRKIYDFLSTNHGHIGQTFIKKLMELGPEGIRAGIAEATNTFHRRYKANFKGEERYWEQAIIFADFAGQLAKDWGLIDFDHSKGIDWVLHQVGAIRRTIVENKVDAFDLLTEYLNDSADAAVTVMHTGTQKPTPDYAHMPRADIRVRFDLYRTDSGAAFDRGTVMVDRTHFRRWLSTRGADYKSFTNELADENVVATPKSQKAYLGKDTPIKLGQSYVIGVNLNHPRLHGILDDADQAAEDLALGQLKGV